MADKLLTSAEVARQLGISESEVARLVTQAKLKAIRLGPEVLRFHPEDVAAWQAAERRPRRPPPPRSPVPGSRPLSAWERMRDLLYAYDFYLVAALLIGAILAVIVSLR